MPVFDFKCPKCGTIEEKILFLNEHKEIMCKKCKVKMKKQMPSPKLIFKGKGFYENDYKNK